MEIFHEDGTLDPAIGLAGFLLVACLLAGVLQWTGERKKAAFFGGLEHALEMAGTRPVSEGQLASPVLNREAFAVVPLAEDYAVVCWKDGLLTPEHGGPEVASTIQVVKRGRLSGVSVDLPQDLAAAIQLRCEAAPR